MTRKTFKNQFKIHPRSFRPLSEQQSFVSNCVPLAIFSIAALKRIGRPSNVARLVISLRIDTIKRVLRCWFVSDLGNEFVKRTETKLDSFTAVARIANVLRIFTASFRGMVCPILRPNIVLQRVSVIESCSRRLSSLRRITAARNRFAPFQCVTPNRSKIATGTFTVPVADASAFFCKANYRKAAKTFANPIGRWFDHTTIITPCVECA